MRRLTMIAMLLAIPSIASAGGGGVDTSGCAGFATGSSVSMLDSCFDGTAHFVAAGSRVAVSNDGQLPHTFTAVDGSFDTGLVDAGGRAELEFDTAGVYQVFCTLHGTADGQGMAGVLVVGEPTPDAVGASVDLSPLEDAIATQRDLILGAMEHQGRVMGRISSTQDEIASAIDVLNVDEIVTSPQVVTVPVAPEGDLVPIAAGLAVGLALAAVAVIWWSRREASVARRFTTMQPSPE